MLEKDKIISFPLIPLILNPLYQNDNFGPLEENIALSPPKSFLNLSDFGILETDVFFILPRLKMCLSLMLINCQGLKYFFLEF